MDAGRNEHHNAPQGHHSVTPGHHGVPQGHHSEHQGQHSAPQGHHSAPQGNIMQMQSGTDGRSNIGMSLAKLKHFKSLGIVEKLGTLSQMLGPVSEPSELSCFGETANSPGPTFVISDLSLKIPVQRK